MHPADFLAGAAARFDANLAAIDLLREIEGEGRATTAEERAILARFSGFGDSTFEPAFRPSVHHSEDRAWVERGQRLRCLVSATEWQSLERPRLNAFFTSPDVIAAMWDGLLALGLDDLATAQILEPAAGIGRFLGLQPQETAVRSVRTAVERDALTARLLKVLYPRTTVHALGFQDAPLRDNSFDVAISNVPFGDFPVADRAYLKPGQRFLTRAVHNIAAVRLPSGTFPDTEVVTDVVILRKRPAAGAPGDDTWLRAAHLDSQVQARWELKRLPQRIADLRVRADAITDDVAFRDAHAPPHTARGDKLFSIGIANRTYADRVEAAPAFAAAIERGAAMSLAAAHGTSPCPSASIATYCGFEVTVRPAGMGVVRLAVRRPEGSEALEYATARTLDLAQLPAYGTGLFQRLDRLLEALDAELKTARDGLAREETNLASYTAQLGRRFEHEEVLQAARRELARIERKLTRDAGSSGSAGAWASTADFPDDAAA